MKRVINALLTLLLSLPMLVIASQTHAQNEVHCGDILEDEFSHPSETHEYTIHMNAGDVLSVSGEVVGETLRFSLQFFDQIGRNMTRNLNYSSKLNRTTPVLSASGTYTISIRNDGIGLYTIKIGCTKRDGTVINPGDTIQPTQPVPANQPLPAPPAFGFPGLPPVDFSSAIELPFVDGQPIVTAVAGNVAIISKLTATAGESYTVNVVRSSGTASLGLTVLDPNNVAVFTVAMGSMDSFTANIKIATDGIYTLGFYNAPLAVGSENTAGAYTITVKKQ